MSHDTNKTIQTALLVAGITLVLWHLHSGQDTQEVLGGTMLTGLVLRLVGSSRS